MAKKQKIRRLKHIRQPKGSGTCQLAVIAMLTGKSWNSILWRYRLYSWRWNWDTAASSYIVAVYRILQHFGIPIDPDTLNQERDWKSIRYIPKLQRTGILFLYCLRVDSHIVAYQGGLVYDSMMHQPMKWQEWRQQKFNQPYRWYSQAETPLWYIDQKE